MRLWIPLTAATLLLAGCPQSDKPVPPAATPTVQATTEPAATPAMSASTSGEMTRGASTPAGEKNPLGLVIPKFKKGENWHGGVIAPKPFPAKFDSSRDYFATIHTTLGDLTVKFFPDKAPKHVTSFFYLAEIGYYDGAPFHRIMRDFMMQGGDPTGTGRGGPGYNVPAEFNDIKHERGILSMARTPDPNSAGSQFFVVFRRSQSAAGLDRQYTVFGKVVEGLELLDKFEALADPRAPNGVPPKSIEKIKSIDVFTKPK